MCVIERWSDNEALVAKAAEALFREGACECGDCAVRDMLPMAAAALDVAQDHAGGAVDLEAATDRVITLMIRRYGAAPDEETREQATRLARAALGGQ